MSNYILETMAGDHFTSISERAKDLAGRQNITVQFDFNDVTCIVDYTTDLELLHRDYCNAYIMEWTTVGPHCKSEYASEVKSELERREKEQEEKHEKEMVEYREKERKEKEEFQSKVEGIEIELSDPDYWNETKRINADDGYGMATIEYSENWAKLMQKEISHGKTLAECAEKTSFELGFLGITGFMYGISVNILSHCWKYGEELRKWHNKEYNYDGDGVVNPAIINLKFNDNEEEI